MRMYDPQIGRFPQSDPLTDEFATLTPYQYASNDPVANIDLDGLEGVGSIGGLVGKGSPIIRSFMEGSTFVMVAAKPVTTSAKLVKGLSLFGKIERIASLAIHSAQLAGHAINGPFVTIAKRALNQVGNKYPNNELLQFYVGWMKEGVGMLKPPDLVGNAVDDYNLVKNGVSQAARGDIKGGALSIAERGFPIVKAGAGEVRLVKSAVNGNIQSLGRVGFQAATVVLGGEEMLANSGAVEAEAASSELQAEKGVFTVTNEGVVLPKGAKIPENFVENAHRSSNYGVMQNGKFVEKVRIDPATPSGFKGPNLSHFHLNNGEHIFDPNKWPWW